MFLLYRAKISGERLQDNCSSGFFLFSFSNVISHYVIICMHIFFFFLLICYVCSLSMKIKLS